MANEPHPEPTVLVIFGAGGDLSKRKLIPGIYYLAEQKLLPDGFALLAVGREPGTDEDYRKLMREAMGNSDEIRKVDDKVWQWLCERTFYASGDFASDDAYASVKKRLEEIESRAEASEKNRLFYLAIPPSVFETALQHLSSSGLKPKTPSYDARPWVRVVIEKPFGRSLADDLLRVSLCDRNPDVVRALANDFHDVGGVEVLEGDLLGLDCDAVVSPANSFGFM